MEYQYDDEGFALNPITNKRFSMGDVYNGQVFKRYQVRVRDNTRYPTFCDEETLQKYRSRYLGARMNRTIDEAVRDCRNGAKYRAKEKNGQCIIDDEFLKETILDGFRDSQKQLICHYKIETAGDRSIHMLTPSLDRFDSRNPDYIFTREMQTCQVVPWVINRLRNADNDDYLLASVVYPWARDVLLKRSGDDTQIPTNLYSSLQNLNEIIRDVLSKRSEEIPINSQNLNEMNDTDFNNYVNKWLSCVN